jgi:hypothetical protein
MYWLVNPLKTKCAVDFMTRVGVLYQFWDRTQQTGKVPFSDQMVTCDNYLNLSK